MTDKIMFDFPVGYCQFHEDLGINYQFNSRGLTNGCPMEEMMIAAEEIKKYDDATPVMVRLAEKAYTQGRVLNAAFYYRMAEFFCFDDKNRKIALFHKFISLFYTALEDDEINLYRIPYENGFLKAIRINCTGEKKGTMVICGGGDSYIEDFYLSVRLLSKKGYDIILFEGPGQGEPLHTYNLKMTYRWEMPIKAVLDFFDTDDVTLVGVSLGGYFALRAAAFENRIMRVVAWDVVYDFFGCVFGRSGMLKYHMLRVLVKINAKSIINGIAHTQMKRQEMMKWIYDQLMYAMGADTPFDYMKMLKKYTCKGISRNIRQDVLLLAGTEDHIIPKRTYKKQLSTLKNAKSVEGRIFTAEENASNHIQIGNIPLAVSYITDWIDRKSNERIG